MAKYTRKKASNGRMMHFKDGKICSKDAYDRAMKSKKNPAKKRTVTSKTGFTKKKASNGRMMYFKNGKICSKDAYDRAMKSKANPKSKKSKVRGSKSSQAAKAMKLYHSGKAKTLKAAWKMVKQK